MTPFITHRCKSDILKITYATHTNGQFPYNSVKTRCTEMHYIYIHVNKEFFYHTIRLIILQSLRKSQFTNSLKLKGAVEARENWQKLYDLTVPVECVWNSSNEKTNVEVQLAFTKPTKSETQNFWSSLDFPKTVDIASYRHKSRLFPLLADNIIFERNRDQRLFCRWICRADSEYVICFLIGPLVLEKLMMIKKR